MGEVDGGEPGIFQPEEPGFVCAHPQAALAVLEEIYDDKRFQDMLECPASGPTINPVSGPANISVQAFDGTDPEVLSGVFQDIGGVAVGEAVGGGIGLHGGTVFFQQSFVGADPQCTVMVFHEVNDKSVESGDWVGIEPAAGINKYAVVAGADEECAFPVFDNGIDNIAAQAVGIVKGRKFSVGKTVKVCGDETDPQVVFDVFGNAPNPVIGESIVGGIGLELPGAEVVGGKPDGASDPQGVVVVVIKGFGDSGPSGSYFGPGRELYFFKDDAVKADETFVGCYPQVTVRCLGNAVNEVGRKAVGYGPMVDEVLPDRGIRVQGECRA